MFRKRRDLLIGRFEGREDLGREGLYVTYFEPMGLDRVAVLQCLDEIELGYEIPPGILRPEDSLEKLNERVSASNPIEWLLWLGRNEFSADDLQEELNIRLSKFGTTDDWERIDTFGDLIRAWCGEKPDNQIS